MTDKIVFIGAGGFIVGVFLRSFFDFGFAFPLFLILISFLLVVWGRFGVWEFSGKPSLFLLSFFFLAVAFGVIRFELSVKEADPELLARVGSFLTVEGVVVGEPDIREDKVFLEVKLEEIAEDDDLRVKVSDKVRVSADFFPEARYGDKILISGRLLVPENFETEGGRPFDYRSYLGKDGIHFEIYKPSVEIVSSGKGNLVRGFLFWLKGKFLDKTGALIEEPENSLMAGLLLGAKHGLGESLTEDFRRSGLVHIIVLSGFNMTIVALAIMWFLERIRLPRLGASIGGIVGIVIFAIMVGMGATAVRASIMAILGIIARLVGRDYRISRALFAAAFIMIMHNPHIAAFDPSFRLSFMATLGLIYLSPIIESKLSFLTKVWSIREIVSATISTQIFVLPLLVSMSGEVSLVSLVANLLVLPLIPVTMLFGFIAGTVAFVSSFLATPFAYVALVFLKYEIFVASFLGSFSFAVVKIPLFLSGAISLSYLFLFGWIFLSGRVGKQPAVLTAR